MRTIELPTPAIHVRATAQLLSVLRMEGKYTFLYCYPLSVEDRFVHKVSKPTKLEVLARAARDYESIYRADSHGIWGHGMEDLVFKEMHIDDASKTITFSMGS